MGGHNIVGSFIYAGKPQLMVPVYFNEQATASKVRALGAKLKHFDLPFAVKGAIGSVDDLAAVGPRK